MVDVVRLIVTNLTRRRLRSAITAVGVAVAVAALYSLASFQHGYQRGMEGELNRLGAHILVVPKGCPYDAASIALHGASWPCYLKNAYLTTVRETQHVAVAAPVFMAALYNASTGAQTVYCGVDPTILQVKRTWHVQGTFPQSSGALLAGSEIATENGWHTSQRVNLPGLPGRSGIVSGILKPTQGADDMFIYLPLVDAQQYFKRPDQLTHILVRLDSPDQMDFVVDHLRGCDAGLDMNVVPMAHLLTTIDGLVQSTRLLLGSVALTALLAAAVGVSNTLLMAVAERTREIGVLRAIGAGRADVFGLILGETVALCFFGAAIGIVAPVLGSRTLEAWLRARLPFTPDGALIAANVPLIAACLLGSVLLGALAGLLPAWRAAGLAPGNAMRSSGAG